MIKLYMAFLLLLLIFPIIAHTQIIINEIYPDTDKVEIKNIGNSTVPIGTWQLCDFPIYNTFNSRTFDCASVDLRPGEIAVVTVSWDISGADGEMGLYINASFGNPASIRDYVEWGSTGHTRSNVAVSAGIWTVNDVVPAFPNTSSLEYDAAGDSSSDWSPVAMNSLCAENATATPIELTSFEAHKLGESKVILQWQTASETNNQGFYLERKIKEDQWMEFGFVEGNGTTQSTSDYSFTDPFPQSGLNDYRLRQVDFDGAFTYSHIASVAFDLPENGLMLYPNPSDGILRFYRSEPVEGAKIQIYDSAGIIVKHMNNIRNTSRIDLSALTKGTYTVKIITDRQVYNKVLVLQ